jgi:protein involved in polysaccharide export with SLBB domain
MKKHSSVHSISIARTLLFSCVALVATTCAAQTEPDTGKENTALPSLTSRPRTESVTPPRTERTRAAPQDAIRNQDSAIRSQDSAIRNKDSAVRNTDSAFRNKDAFETEVEKGAFQVYVEKISGRELPVFGRNLFSQVPDTFAPTDGAQVNPDYVIGTGDELQIRGWGMIDIDVSGTVDRNGSIYVPKVGAVKVAGIKYSDLQGYLKKAISKNFSGFDLTVSVAQTRAVQVYVVGHAARPGTYTLSAMSTLLNALFVSGGPSESGTMRRIEIKRGGKTVTTFDLYDMLIKGDKTRDLALHDGDVIHIPETGPMVALIGNVKTPAIFELNGPATAADIISWAGGVDSAAENKQVVVEKNLDNMFKPVAEVSANTSMSAALNAIPLQPADVLRVFAPGAVPIEAQIQNEYVQVSGEVRQPGVYLIRKGETLRELLSRLGGATDNGYVFATKLQRESVRRAQQAKLDEVADRFERDLETNANQRMASTTDSENAAKITAETARMREQAQRMRQIKGEGRIVLELQDARAQINNLPDISLIDGDRIYVPRKPGTVDVLGSVFQQNSFIYKPSRTVSDYLNLAGGPTATADKSELYVIRADGTAKSGRNDGWYNRIDKQVLNPGDTVVVPERLDRTTWTQSFKEWTTILYQFGLGAAGLKVLKN